VGTRADFYIRKVNELRWIGSIAWDGYPRGIPKNILQAKNESEYAKSVSDFVSIREDKTLPEDGWPWPWDDSTTTDYAYAFDGEKVIASCFGGYWFDPLNKPCDDPKSGEKPDFPNMKSVQNVSFGKNSGVILITT